MSYPNSQMQSAYGIMAAFPSLARGTAACSPAAHSETTQLHARRENKQL